MKKTKSRCQRPDCKRKATVTLYRDTVDGRKELKVCQVDVQWAWGQLHHLAHQLVKP